MGARFLLTLGVEVLDKLERETRMNSGVWGWSQRHWYEVKFSFTHTHTRVHVCMQSDEWEESSFTAISLGHWEIEKAQIF